METTPNDFRLLGVLLFGHFTEVAVNERVAVFSSDLANHPDCCFLTD
jgi:hypothetical protein